MGSISRNGVYFGTMAMVLLSLCGPARGQDSSGSNGCITALVPCASYLNATKPPSSCCSPLVTEYKTNKACLCNLLNSTDLIKQFKINITQAFELPIKCGLNASASGCSKLHSWTVSLFIASFLKLALAFLFLWVAWVSFVTAKFLSFFGLHLPYTCNDFTEDKNSGVENICVQAALMDCPSRMISTTGSSDLHRFPFEGVCTHEGSCSSYTLNTRAMNKRSIGGPFDRSLAGRKILSSDPCHWNSVGPEDFIRGPMAGEERSRDLVKILLKESADPDDGGEMEDVTGVDR